MTASTVSTHVALRPATADDREFLIALYGSTRDDLSLLPLDTEQRDALVRMQFHAQDVHYRQQHPRASFDVVELAGRPAGRLYVERAVDEIRIIEVSLLPELRGSGLGTALIRAVQEEAAATGRTVSLHVTTDNPAAALYARLGFRLVEDLGIYRRLEWRRP